MIRLLGQKAAIADQRGLCMRDWFTMFADMVRAINNSRFTGSGTRYSHTGDLVSTEMVTIPVQMGNSGIARLAVATSTTSNANAKTLVIKIGGTTVQTVTLGTNTASQSVTMTIVGRGASSQYVSCQFTNATGSGNGAYAVDMSGTAEIALFLQLGTISDTVAIESWTLEVEQA